MQDITFSKNGEQFESSPVFGNGNGVVRYQIGFKESGARVLVEHSFAPAKGWQLLSDKVAPKMPDYLVGMQYIPSGTYIRFRTNVEPVEVMVDTSNLGQGDCKPEEGGNVQEGITREIVNSLDDVVTPNANTIYMVKNGNSEGNKYDEYFFTDGEFELLGATDEKTVGNVLKGIEENGIVTDQEIEGLF